MLVGNKDVIKNGTDGFVCKTDKDYFDIIQKILENQVDVQKITENARQKIIDNHDVEMVTAKYLEIYKKGDDSY